MQCYSDATDPPMVPVLSPEQCSGVVLLEPKDIPPNPLFLTMEQGTLVSGAVGSVWIAAWAWRAIRAALRDRGE